MFQSRPDRSHHTMVDFNLIAQMGVDDAAVDALLNQADTTLADGNMEELLAGEMQSYSRGKVLAGKVVGKAGDDAIVDVGLKSEGLVNKSEFDNWDELGAGDEIEVLLEDLDDGTGILKLSKRKADDRRAGTTGCYTLAGQPAGLRYLHPNLRSRLCWA